MLFDLNEAEIDEVMIKQQVFSTKPQKTPQIPSIE
jgi:hypothetical protein